MQNMMPMERLLLTFMVQALFDVQYGEVGKKRQTEKTNKKDHLKIY